MEHLNIRQLYEGDGAREVMRNLRSEDLGGRGKRKKYRINAAGKDGETIPIRLQGMGLIESNDGAFVRLELKMPDMDGMEALNRIQAMEQALLVTVITGFATIEPAIEAMKRGATDFIPKPFEPDQRRIVVNRAREKSFLKKEALNLEKERRRTLADLGTEKSRMLIIVDSIPNRIVVTNVDGRVVLMNPAFRRMLIFDEALAIGQEISAYIDDEYLCALILEISSGRPVDFDEIPAHAFSIRDDWFFMARGRPVLGSRRACPGAVGTFVDFLGTRARNKQQALVVDRPETPLPTIKADPLALESIIRQPDRQCHQRHPGRRPHCCPDRHGWHQPAGPGGR